MDDRSEDGHRADFPREPNKLAKEDNFSNTKKRNIAPKEKGRCVNIKNCVNKKLGLYFGWFSKSSLSTSSLVYLLLVITWDIYI